jgi:hypothetical protein
MKTGVPKNQVRLRAKLYRVALVRWVDIPKRALAGVDFPPALDQGKVRAGRRCCGSTTTSTA